MRVTRAIDGFGSHNRVIINVDGLPRSNLWLERERLRVAVNLPAPAFIGGRLGKPETVIALAAARNECDADHLSIPLGWPGTGPQT